MELLFVNPITIWLRWLFKKVYLQLKNTNLRIDYLADIENSKFGKYNTIYKLARLRNAELGDFTYVSKNSQLYNIKVGKFCSIGPNVMVGSGVHPTSEYVSSHPIFYSSIGQSQLTFYKESRFQEYPFTEIGNDVWIGANVILKDGVKIGDGAIIGAGAVVTKNVAPYSIVGGVPAKEIKYRFTEYQIEFLNSFKWWEMDIEWIQNNKELFTNIELFMAKYGK